MRKDITHIASAIGPDSWEHVMNVTSSLSIKPGTPEFRLVLEWAPIPNRDEVLARYDAMMEGQSDA